MKALAASERQVTARLIATLAEIDARRLYLAEGYSSLFTYCTHCLRLSEHAAYGRIGAARAARTFPLILELLADGSLTLTTVCLLATHLTPDNHQQLLANATHKSKREVEQQLAAVRPLPAVPSIVRKLPAPRPVPVPQPTLVAVESDRGIPALSAVAEERPRPSARPTRPAVVAPLALERYKVQFTVTRETHDKLRRVQDLIRHSVPDGDPAVIFDRALTLLLTQLEKTKLGRTDRPRPATEAKVTSRHVPAHVRREVWARDGGQCAFVGRGGTLRRTWISGVPPCRSVRSGGPDDECEPAAPLQSAQRS